MILDVALGIIVALIALALLPVLIAIAGGLIIVFFGVGAVVCAIFLIIFLAENYPLDELLVVGVGLLLVTFVVALLWSIPFALRSHGSLWLVFHYSVGRCAP